MKAKLLTDTTEHTFVLIFQTGDEVVTGLQEFAKAKDLTGSHFTAIGALSDVIVAWFDWGNKSTSTCS